MKFSISCALMCALLVSACGDDSETEFPNSGTGGSAGVGGSSGGSGGSAGASAGGAAGAGAGGSAAGGSAGAGGTSPSGGAAGNGGVGAQPACPGTAPGCVVDWAGQFGQQGSVDAVGAQARFNTIGDITGDAKYLWVATDHAVRRVEIASAAVTTFAGQLGANGYVNATGSAARFGSVTGIATDGKTLWVTDSGNVVIRAVDIASAAVSAVAGSPGQPGSQDGTGPQARFDDPRGLAWDGTYLYLAETNNNSVRRIDPKTGAVITLGGKNGQGALNGAGSVAQFNRPRGIEVFQGTVYVGDTENHQIRALVPGTNAATSTVSTPVGAGAGYKDGTGTAALFRRLRGITNDGAALIVADSDNFVIRKVELPSLAVTTIAGTGMNQGHAVGIGSAAAFDKPMDVHFDAATGDLFIVEGTVIRRMYYK